MKALNVGVLMNQGVDFNYVMQINDSTGAPIDVTGYEFLSEMRLSTQAGTPIAGGIEAQGVITFTANPAINDTLTVGGTLITFVSGVPSGNQVQIGATLLNTVAALLLFLEASKDVNLVEATYSVDVTGLLITVTFVVVGLIGNAFTLAISSAGNTVSGATLSGGIDPAEFVFTILNQVTNKGQVKWFLPRAQVDTIVTSVSDDLRCQRLKTPYVFDVKMKDTSSNTSRILEGFIYVSPQATQEVLP
jgi:hypothetical protein